MRASKFPSSVLSLVRIGVLTAVLCCFPHTARGQSLANGGFEGTPIGVSGCANITGQIAQGWSENTCWDTSAPVIEYAVDSVNPHSGLTSQRISLKSGRRVQFVQWLNPSLAAGTRYQARVWLRGEAGGVVMASVRQAGAPFRGYLAKLIRLSTEWRQYTFDGVTEATDAVFILSAERPVTFWVDDASFISVGASVAPTLPAQAVPKANFGMHYNYLDTPWPAVGDNIGAIRIWDAGNRADYSGTGSQWEDISPARGVYDWSGLDARVDAARTRGADVLMTLGGRTPRWASARPDESAESPGGGSPYGPGQAAEPANVQDWRDWVTAVATRYKGRIKYWEIWNEPMYKNFYSGTPDKLLELWREAWTILKTVDPENRVLTPSGDLPWLDYLLSNGGLAFTDIVNTHYYVAKPEDVHDIDGRNLLSMLERVGARGKPLWNTEAGWLDFSQPRITLTQAEGAAYVARAYLLNWASGATRFYWYTWDNLNNQFAMREADGVTLTPAGRSYREIAGWMTGATMLSASTDAGGHRRIQLRRADGTLAHVLWNPAGSVDFPVPPEWNVARVRDLAGGARAWSGAASLTIGPAPLLLETAAAAAVALIVDNATAGVRDVTRNFTGAWCTSVAPASYGSSSLYSCGAGTDTYRWTPNLAAAGEYDVYVWWTSNSTRTARVPVRVTHATGVSEIFFDQRSSGGQWVLHGRYGFAAGAAGFAEISDINGLASADAVRWVPVSGTPGPVPDPGASAPTVIVDNAASGVSDTARSFGGQWCTSRASGYYGTGSLYSCGAALESYRWRLVLPQAGDYAVYVRWTSHANRSARVPILVSHRRGNAIREFDQRVKGGSWVLHGVYAFAAGSAAYVEVDDRNGQASADAVKFVLLSGTPPPTATNAPAVLFTDVAAGPVRGGPDDAGVPIALYGRGFGATRGSSRVTINGVEVARYLVWGQNNANNNALDMIVVQPGAAVSAGPVVVTVGGAASNADTRFTPTTGTVYTVAPTGSDSAPCTGTQPCATVLHAATNVMRAGDALLVRGGVMNDDEVWIRREYGHSGTAAAPKVIRNYPGETPVFSRGNRPFILDADYLTLSGLRFENRKSLVVGYERGEGARVYNNRFRGAIDYDAIGTHGNDIVLAGNDCQVTSSTVGTQGHCYYISNGSGIALRYNIARGAPGYGIHIFDQRRAANDIVRVIRNVLVEGNLLAGSTQRSGLIAAMGDEDGIGNHIDGVTIRNNLFAGSNFAGIAIGGNTRNVRILHNTFYANGRQGVTIYDDASIAGVELRNNLFDQGANTNCTIDCSWYQVAHAEVGARARGVVVMGNYYAPGTPTLRGASDSAARSGAAGFVDAAGGDLHLLAGSGAIDLFTVLPTVTLDFDGRIRPLGKAVDAGAYEYGQP